MTTTAATSRETFLIRNTQGGRWLVVSGQGDVILAHDGYADPELAARAVRNLALGSGRCDGAEIVRDPRGIPRMVDVSWFDPGIVV